MCRSVCVCGVSNLKMTSPLLNKISNIKSINSYLSINNPVHASVHVFEWSSPIWPMFVIMRNVEILSMRKRHMFRIPAKALEKWTAIKLDYESKWIRFWNMLQSKINTYQHFISKLFLAVIFREYSIMWAERPTETIHFGFCGMFMGKLINTSA